MSFIRACCCDAAVCPTDCSACDDPLSVTVAGLTGDCACANKTYSLARSGCSWTVTVVNDVPNNKCGVTVTINCAADMWHVRLDVISLGAFYSSDTLEDDVPASACPTGLTFAATPSFGPAGCAGQTATITT